MAIIYKAGPTTYSDKNKLNLSTTVYAFHEDGKPVIEPKTGEPARFIVFANDLTKESIEDRMGVEKTAFEERLALVATRDAAKPALDAIEGQVITPKPSPVVVPPSAEEIAYQVARQKLVALHFDVEIGLLANDDPEYVAARDEAIAAKQALKDTKTK
jgi:hypothetical protein